MNRSPAVRNAKGDLEHVTLIATALNLRTDYNVLCPKCGEESPAPDLMARRRPAGCRACGFRVGWCDVSASFKSKATTSVQQAQWCLSPVEDMGCPAEDLLAAAFWAGMDEADDAIDTAWAIYTSLPEAVRDASDEPSPQGIAKLAARWLTAPRSDRVQHPAFEAAIFNAAMRLSQLVDQALALKELGLEHPENYFA